MTSQCDISCQGLYLDVEHIDDENHLPMDDDGLSDETLELFEEYKKYRNGDVEQILSVMEHVVQDKTGWPFKTTQNNRVPLFKWICLGPVKQTLPKDCTRKMNENNHALKAYCNFVQESIDLTPVNCTNPKDS